MNKLTMLLALAGMLSATGCKKKPAENGGGSNANAMTTTGSATGSAEMGSGSAAAMAGSGSAGSAEAAKMTADDITKRFQECWGYFNDGKWDDFQKCHADDATHEMPGSGMPAENGAAAIAEAAKNFKAAFPDMKGQNQLLLINGNHLAAVSLMTGTNTGKMQTPMGEMPPTNHKVGFYTSQLMELNDQGQATKAQEYVDFATIMGQLKPDKKHPVRPVADKLAMPQTTVVAKDDDTEKANVETDKKLVDAFNAHDAKAFGALLDDHLVWTEYAAPKDMNKAETVKGTEGLWKGFSDVKLNVADQWGAGDFVVSTGTMDGTNNGPVPDMGVKKATNKKISLPYLEIDQVAGGKVTHAWLFYQSMALMQQMGMMPAAGEKGEKGEAGEKGEKAEKHEKTSKKKGK